MPHGRKVILKGGASPNNIYWSAGTAATFAANCIIEGNIFAGTAITYAAGCTHHGRYDSTHQHLLFPSLSALTLSLSHDGAFYTYTV